MRILLSSTKLIIHRVGDYLHFKNKDCSKHIYLENLFNYLTETCPNLADLLVLNLVFIRSIKVIFLPNSQHVIGEKLSFI